MPSPREAKHFINQFWQDSGKKLVNARAIPLPTSPLPLLPRLETAATQVPSATSFDREKGPVKVVSQVASVKAAAESHPEGDLHIGFVRLDATLTEAELSTFATTLVQLQRLGLSPVILLHWDDIRSLTSTGRNDQLDVLEVLQLPKRHRRRRYHLRDDKHSQRWNYARAVMMHESLRVVDAIDRAGGRGLSFYSDVFTWLESQPSNSQPKLNVQLESLKPLQKAFDQRQIPVLIPLGSDAAGLGQISLLSSKACLLALTELARTKYQHKESPRSQLDSYAEAPSKLFLINRRGGLCVDKRPIRFVNLADEYYELSQQIHLNDQDATKQVTTPMLSNSSMSDPSHPEDGLIGGSSIILQRSPQLEDLDLAHSVLGALPSSSSAVIAAAAGSTSSLISNLITDKPMTGANQPAAFRDPHSPHHPQPQQTNSSFVSSASLPAVTYTRPTLLRRGLHVTQHSSLDTVDLPKLKKLLESSFRKVLQDAAFWDRIRPIIGSVIVAGDYEGAAIVTMEPDPVSALAGRSHKTVSNVTLSKEGVPYLDKFSVDPKAQGIGVADILWKRLCREYPDLVWRSRADNPVNKW
jgi:amino-acid N-acetyltransferase